MLATSTDRLKAAVVSSSTRPKYRDCVNAPLSTTLICMTASGRRRFRMSPAYQIANTFHL
jgi:hypothetical protein